MEISTLNTISSENQTRYQTGINYLDNLLGGGIVPGETILFAGLPGAGKSTLLLQIAHALAVIKKRKVLYINGEESKEAIKSRAQRLFIDSKDIYLFDETKVEDIFKASNKIKPDVIIIDSLQMLSSLTLRTAPGTPSQMRMSLMSMCALAKRNKIAIFFVGHSTKGGYVAGLQTLQHMVDAVFFLGVSDDMSRFLKTSKNRYGATTETENLYMTPFGLTDDKYSDKPLTQIHDHPLTETDIKEKLQGSFMKPFVLASIKWLTERAKEKGLLGNTTSTISSRDIDVILTETPNPMVKYSLNYLERSFKNDPEII